jgi:hypothetical protein
MQLCTFVSFCVPTHAAAAVLIRPQLQRLVSTLGRAPLVGNLVGFAFNLIEGMQQYYSYVET